MTADGLAGIVARDADVPWSAALQPLQVSEEYVWQTLDDRRALLVLLKETRDALGALSTRHDWQPGIGMCVCHPHDTARTVLPRLAALDPEPVR